MEKSNNRVLNELLVNLFHNVMDAEAKAVITDEFKDITNNDMHILEAIGIEEPKEYVPYRWGTPCYRGYPDHEYEQSGEKRISHPQPQHQR